MLRKFKKLQARFRKLKGSRSKTQYQELREDLSDFTFDFLDDYYTPAHVEFLQKEHAYQFAYLKEDTKLRLDRDNGLKVPNIKNELQRRVEKYAAEKLEANIKFLKLGAYKKYLEDTEKAIASQLR